MNIKNKLFKLKGYFFALDKKWDDNNLSPENIEYYIPKVLDYQTERFIDGKPTKEYIIASSGECINESLRNNINKYNEILEVFKKYKLKEDITVYRTVSFKIYELMKINAKNIK